MSAPQHRQRGDGATTMWLTGVLGFGVLGGALGQALLGGPARGAIVGVFVIVCLKIWRMQIGLDRRALPLTFVPPSSV